MLKDVGAQKREALFQQKLQLCSVVFQFDDPNSDQRGKDIKRQTLMELLDFVNTQAGEKMFTEGLYADIMAMVSARSVRTATVIAVERYSASTARSVCDLAGLG